MKVGIMQPYLFPYLGYFQLINAVDTYVIYDDVQFITRGWINRNNILIDGQKHLFTFPLVNASSNKAINETELVGDFSEFEKTLTRAYAKSPYFKSVSALIHKICVFEDKNLARFVGNSIIQIAEYLDIKTEFIYSSDLQKETRLKAQDKIIAICKELHADTYINAIGGQELYYKEAFKRHNIELQFLQPKLEEYKQIKSEFMPSLSIIDVMMFNSPGAIRAMLVQFELL